MSSAAMLDGGDEAALQAFLSALAPAQAVPVRTLAHAWQAAGGAIQVGRVTVRLCTTGRDGRPFTAATLHASGAERGPPRSGEARPGGPVIEVARVLLANHGVGDADWRSWCDDLEALQLPGFDEAAKYPSVTLDGLPDASVARLAQALRDLCRLAQGHPS